MLMHMSNTIRPIYKKNPFLSFIYFQFSCHKGDILAIIVLLTASAAAWVLSPSVWIRNLVRFSRDDTAEISDGVSKQRRLFLIAGVFRGALHCLYCLTHLTPEHSSS